MIVVKEELYTHRSLETGGVKLHKRPCGEAPGSVRRQREKKRKSMALSLYWGFCGRNWEEGGPLSQLKVG